MKKISLWMIAACAIMAVVTVRVSHKEETTDELMMSNIEALASEEDDWISVSCYGDGNVDCPLGGKASYVIKGYSLR